MKIVVRCDYLTCAPTIKRMEILFDDKISINFPPCLLLRFFLTDGFVTRTSVVNMIKLSNTPILKNRAEEPSLQLPRSRHEQHYLNWIDFH